MSGMSAVDTQGPATVDFQSQEIQGYDVMHTYINTDSALE